MANKLSKAQVTLPSDHEVEVTRQFAAPRALVYEAYTTPSLVQRWLLGPPGWTMPVCTMDVRVGGKFRWRWRNDQDGKEFGFHGRRHDARKLDELWLQGGARCRRVYWYDRRHGAKLSTT